MCGCANNQIIVRMNVPSRSIVSFILLAAFSLRSPGWLLLMENRVITPAEGRQQFSDFTFTSRCHPDLVGDLTPYEEVASYDEHHTDGGQDKTGTVQVVLVSHEADPTYRVSIHLVGDICVSLDTVQIDEKVPTHSHLAKT